MIPNRSGDLSGLQLLVGFPQQLRDIEALRATRCAISTLRALVTFLSENPGASAAHFGVPPLGIVRHIKRLVHLAPVEQSRNVDVFGARQTLIADGAEFSAQLIAIRTFNLTQDLVKDRSLRPSAIVVLRDQIRINLLWRIWAER